MLTTDTIRELIADFRERWIPELVPRETGGARSSATSWR
jgi:hypothetical protein